MDSASNGREACIQEEEMSMINSPYLPAAMRRDTWRVEQFKLHKQVYEGRTSRLFLATDRQSGVPVALKLYRKRKLTELNRTQVEREINIHVGLLHESIVKLYAAFEDERNVYLVLELAEGGDLFHKVKSSAAQCYTSERRMVQEVLVPFLKVLSYLHGKGIVHRDIKPENILLAADGSLKLADFGLAIDTQAERPVTRLGTLDYMAPEVLLCPDKKLPHENKERSDLIYSTEVDIWSVGILAYELLAGRAPFERDSRLQTFEHILTQDPEYPCMISEAARSFIRSTLVKDPSKRPSAAELLEHPWVQSYRQHSTSGSTTCKDTLRPAAGLGATVAEPSMPPQVMLRSFTTPAAVHGGSNPKVSAGKAQQPVQPSSPAPVARTSPGVSGPETPPASRQSRSFCQSSTQVHTSIGSSSGSRLEQAQGAPRQHPSAPCLAHVSAPVRSAPGSTFSRQSSLTAVLAAQHGSGGTPRIFNAISLPSVDQGPFPSSPRMSRQGSLAVSSSANQLSQSTVSPTASTMPVDPSPSSFSQGTVPLPPLFTPRGQAPGIGHGSMKPRPAALSIEDGPLTAASSHNLAAILSPTLRTASQPAMGTAASPLTTGTSSATRADEASAMQKAPFKAKGGLGALSQGLAALLSPKSKKAPAPPAPPLTPNAPSMQGSDGSNDRSTARHKATNVPSKLSKLFSRAQPDGTDSSGDAYDAVIFIGPPNESPPSTKSMA